MQIEHDKVKRTTAEKLADVMSRLTPAKANHETCEARSVVLKGTRDDARLNNTIDPLPDNQELLDKAQDALDAARGTESSAYQEVVLLEDAKDTLQRHATGERQQQRQESVQVKHANAITTEADAIEDLRTAVGMLMAIGKVKNDIFPDLLGLLQRHCGEVTLHPYTDRAMAKLAAPAQH